MPPRGPARRRSASLAEARIGQHLDHVRQPAAGAVQPIAPLTSAVQAPHDRDLAQRQIDGPVGVVQHDSTSAAPRAARRDRRRRSRPASTARTASGDCSPIAHRTASVTFNLPEPFGPTTTLTPGPKSRCVRSGKDLKPFNVSDFRRIQFPASFAGQPVHGLSRSLLLGVLLAPAASLAPDRSSTFATTANVRSCGGPVSPVIS